MKPAQVLLTAVVALTALFVASARVLPPPAWSATVDQAAGDADGDGIADTADACPSLAEDADGIDDLDGCPDTDLSVTATKDEAFDVAKDVLTTKTVDVWIENGNYPADILVHLVAVSTFSECEVHAVDEPGDGKIEFVTDEDSDTVADTLQSLLEWETSLAAGQTYHTTRDYEIACPSVGTHSFEIQVDAVPWPPVEEEDVEDLPNVHKNFPLVTVTANGASDSDSDGFSDAAEEFMGTLPTVACPATPAADDEDPDAWPTDLDDNRAINILDIVQLTPPVFGSAPPDPTYSNRKDLTADGTINILDVVQVTPPTFGSSCAP